MKRKRRGGNNSKIERSYRQQQRFTQFCQRLALVAEICIKRIAITKMDTTYIADRGFGSAENSGDGSYESH